MEVLLSARSVRLLSCDRGLYLAAEEHGGEVFLAGRAAPNTVWGVHAFTGADADGEPAVLLRSAYGRYLLATEVPATTGSSGAATVMHMWYPLARQSPLPSMLWQAVRRQDGVVIRNFAGSFLRANGRYLRWRRAVTVAGDSSSSMMLWTVEVVPIDLESPSALDAPTLATLLELTVAQLDEQLSRKRSLQTDIHARCRRMEELEIDRKRVARIGDACLLSRTMNHASLAAKAYNALCLKLAACENSIRDLQEQKEHLQAEIQKAAPPRRWSW